MPIKEIKINLPQGTYETIVFAADDGLSPLGKYVQLLEDMEEWKDSIPRCRWWIAKIKMLLAKRGYKNGS